MINSIIARFDSLHLEYGEFAISHIGQHSFILKLGGTVIYIDPYLTPGRARLIAPLLKPEELLTQLSSRVRTIMGIILTCWPGRRLRHLPRMPVLFCRKPCGSRSSGTPALRGNAYSA